MPRLILDMTAKQYKKAREARGTQAAVARMLKIARPTISHRERGVQPITREASLAIQALPIGAVLDKAFKSKPKKTK